VIDINTAPLKSYADAPKYRAVLWQYFNPLERVKKERELYVKNGGTKADAEIVHPDPPLATVDEMVMMALDWVFNPYRTIAPQRFNDASFPALYTAKEPQTATEELRSGTGTGHEYVIFLVWFTGDALDLRPAVTSGHMKWPLSYPDCQAAALSARGKSPGLASPSAQRPTGSCCTIFFRKNVEPGPIFDRGFL
jgi:hypothetical protein